MLTFTRVLDIFARSRSFLALQYFLVFITAKRPRPHTVNDHSAVETHELGIAAGAGLVQHERQEAEVVSDYRRVPPFAPATIHL